MDQNPIATKPGQPTYGFADEDGDSISFTPIGQARMLVQMNHARGDDDTLVAVEVDHGKLEEFMLGAAKVAASVLGEKPDATHSEDAEELVEDVNAAVDRDGFLRAFTDVCGLCGERFGYHTSSGDNCPGTTDQQFVIKFGGSQLEPGKLLLDEFSSQAQDGSNKLSGISVSWVRGETLGPEGNTLLPWQVRSLAKAIASTIGEWLESENGDPHLVLEVDEELASSDQ